MLKHADIWKSIDSLSKKYGYSVSGLARKAGLDPTTFNKSKRVAANGKLRWPSMESISKILAATGASLGEFIALVGENESLGVFYNVPLLNLSQAANRECFDDQGRPIGNEWDEIPFPDVGDPYAYALEISEDDMEPIYRNGGTLIVSPHASIRRADRIVVRTRHGEILIRELVRITARKVELRSFNPDQADRVISTDEVDWMARILWVSQ